MALHKPTAGGCRPENLTAPEQPRSAADFGGAFALGIVLNATFAVAEAIVGLAADSLALVADAGHNLGDVAGLVLAWGAARLARWQPTDRHTYGFRRATILAALANAFLLLVAIGAIGREAIGRLLHPVPVAASAVIWMATAGIGVNAATALLFAAGRRTDLNVRGAFLHMVADAGVSLAVVAAGILVRVTGMHALDPLVSLAVLAVILTGTWGLLRESFALAMDAVPEGIEATAVEALLARLPAVQSVHHLHIWGLGTTDTALTVHLVVSRAEWSDDLLARVRDELQQHFGIGHATIQLESPEAGTCLTRRCTLTAASR